MLDDLVEEGGAVGLVVVACVVSLAEQDGDELGPGLEVAAGLAGGFHAAFELDRAGAESVAEHAGVVSRRSLAMETVSRSAASF